jgi:hypothetical protein
VRLNFLFGLVVVIAATGCRISSARSAEQTCMTVPSGAQRWPYGQLLQEVADTLFARVLGNAPLSDSVVLQGLGRFEPGLSANGGAVLAAAIRSVANVAGLPEQQRVLGHVLGELIRSGRVSVAAALAVPGNEPAAREQLVVVHALEPLIARADAVDGLGQIACREVGILAPAFDSGSATTLLDLSVDTSPFVEVMRVLSNAGPTGQRQVERVLAAVQHATPFRTFVRRVVRGAKLMRRDEALRF